MPDIDLPFKLENDDLSDERQASYRSELARDLMGEQAPSLWLHGVTQRSGTVYVGELLRLHPHFHAFPNDIWEAPILMNLNKLLEFEESFFANYKFNEGKIERMDFITIIGSAFLQYLRRFVSNDRRVLMKEPRVEYLKYFFTLFPEEHLVLLMRDGRDVVQSTMKTWPNESFENICRRWEKSARLILDFIEMPNLRKDQVFYARYEDVVEDADGFIKAICEKFNLEVALYPFDQIDQIPLRGSSSIKESGEVTWNPVDKSKSFKTSGKYLDWTPRMKQNFKKFAGKTLIEAGYADDFEW